MRASGRGPPRLPSPSERSIIDTKRPMWGTGPSGPTEHGTAGYCGEEGMMTDSNGRRAVAAALGFNAASWTVLACGLLTVTLSFGLDVYRLGLPSPGWSLDSLAQARGQFVFTEKLTDAPSPIQ